jgi:cellulose synthase/poly-beta-1,6-N-acetylglucosamine synthase-like glycosyltransferase
LNFSNFFGSNAWTIALCIVAICIVAGDIIVTAVTVLYQRFWYDSITRKKFDESYTPRCSVILPCKGIPRDFEKNVGSFLSLDYSNYKMIFALESETDTALPVIRKLIKDKPMASVVIAGLATECSQKNHNMLAAIKNADNPEIYVFADADISPAKNWLKELVLPLSSPGITVTTGFRWLTAVQARTCEYVHAYINIFLYVLLTFINFAGGTFLWGGSMAIRRKDFDDLKVADLWSHAVVDDNSLSQLIMKKSRRSVVVPSCITKSDDLLTSTKQGIAWFTRQIMFLKSYEKAIWFFIMLPLVLLALLLFTWLPVAIIASKGSVARFLEVGGGASVIFIAGELITASLYPLLGSVPKFYKFLVLQPFMRTTHIISSLRTVYTNKIVWSGVKYHMTFTGKVSKVERLVHREKTTC